MAKMIRRDDSFEFQFVMDYAEFGLRINFEAAAALYEKARTMEDLPQRKSICLAGLQFMFSSWEDFALLLLGFNKRKVGEPYLDQFLFAKGQKLGSSPIPSVFKNYQSARQ